MITSLSQLDLNKTYTYADYLLWQFEDRVELIKGKIMQMAAPSRAHQQVTTNLILAIGNSLRHSHCKIYPAPFDVRLPHFSQKKNKDVVTVVQPDICIICDPAKLDKRGCIGAPDIVIEILSPGNSKREMKDKFSIYEESGVPEYWIISLSQEAIQVFRLNEQGKYYGTQPYVEGDNLTTPVLPGISISLKDVFAD
jgi:Uma2 family endonuclease